MKMHKHHIVPKHANGTNDSSNLIELTIEDCQENKLVKEDCYGITIELLIDNSKKIIN